MKCSGCSRKLSPGKIRCVHCGLWNHTGGETETNAVSLADVAASDVDRIVLGPWDVCFGGGIVRDSAVFLAGEPGAGKSTLLLAVAVAVGQVTSKKVLYISKEETMGAVKARAIRLKLDTHALGWITIVSIFKGRLRDLLQKEKPVLTILDSLPGLVGVGPGHLDDAVEALTDLKEYADECKSPSIIVDQVNKEFDFAGEMALQHLVDATIMLKGKEDHPRVLRTRKNRHGPGGATVTFQMTETGLVVPEQPTSEEKAKKF